MTNSWDEVLENPSAPPEAGHAVHPSHDAGMAGDGQWEKDSHDAQEVLPDFLRGQACSGEVGRNQKASPLRAHLLPLPLAKSGHPVQ